MMPLSPMLFEPLKRSADSLGLPAFLKSLEKELSAFSRAHEGFLSRLTDYVLTGEGKRLRPALVFLSAQFGKPSSKDVLRISLAVEMIHSIQAMKLLVGLMVLRS